ncbi:hypothetical protein DFH09DRAFT_1097819 [Mycena vulgaris]|nr:hypothetical protein DFH09DRAFT_1097819 [Mycena vulgaris]
MNNHKPITEVKIGTQCFRDCEAIEGNRGYSDENHQGRLHAEIGLVVDILNSKAVGVEHAIDAFNPVGYLMNLSAVRILVKSPAYGWLAGTGQFCQTLSQEQLGVLDIGMLETQGPPLAGLVVLLLHIGVICDDWLAICPIWGVHCHQQPHVLGLLRYSSLVTATGLPPGVVITTKLKWWPHVASLSIHCFNLCMPMKSQLAWSTKACTYIFCILESLHVIGVGNMFMNPGQWWSKTSCNMLKNGHHSLSYENLSSTLASSCSSWMSGVIGEL